MTLSFCTSYLAGLSPFRTTVWAAVVVAFLVAARRTAAAPGPDRSVSNIHLIGDQLCHCVTSNSCAAEDEVLNSPESIGCANFENEVCCLINEDKVVSSSTHKNTSIGPSFELPKCSCVQQNRCSEQSPGNGKCMNDKEVCCEKQFIEPENTNVGNKTTYTNTNNNYNTINTGNTNTNSHS